MLQTLIVGRAVFVKSFDIACSYLKTDNSIIDLSLGSDTRTTVPYNEVPRFQGYGFSPRRVWITWDSENLLWLPPEYRPATCTVALSTISTGCVSGRVLIFNFDSQRLLHALAGH